MSMWRHALLRPVPIYIYETQRQKGFLLDPEKAKKAAEFEAKNGRGLLNRIRECIVLSPFPLVVWRRFVV